MARTFLGRVAKGSIAPANKQFAEFVEESNSNPISLARNRQERLNYNVAQNLQQADQGLISNDRESVMAKSYFDAKQADSIQQGDLIDSYNRDRLKGNLQEKLTLKKAGLDLSSMDKTEKKTDTKGNIFERTITTGANQTTRADKDLGGVRTEDYGIGTNVGEWRKTKNATTLKTRSGSGKTFKKNIEWSVPSKITTYEEGLNEALSASLKMNETLAGDSGKLGDVMSIARKIASSEVEFGDGISKIREIAPDFDPALLDVAVGKLAEYEASYVPSQVIKSNGTTTEVNLRPMDKALKMRFADNSTQGGYIDIPVVGHTDQMNGRYGELKGSDGNYYKIAERDFPKYQSIIVKNHKRTDGTDGYYQLDIGAGGDILEKVTPLEQVKSLTNADGSPTEQVLSQQKARLDSGDKDFERAMNTDNEYAANLVNVKLEWLNGVGNGPNEKPSDAAKKLIRNNPKLSKIQLASKMLYDDMKGGRDMQVYLDGDGNLKLLGKQLAYLRERTNPTTNIQKGRLLDVANNKKLEVKLLKNDGDTLTVPHTDITTVKNAGTRGGYTTTVQTGYGPKTFTLPDNVTERNVHNAVAAGIGRLFNTLGEDVKEATLKKRTSQVKYGGR